MKSPLEKKFKVLMLFLSLLFFAAGGYVFYTIFQTGKDLSVKHIMGGGASVLIGALILSRIRVHCCRKCGKELVEGCWLFPPELLNEITGTLESERPDALAVLVGTSPKPLPPTLGGLSYAAVDFEICPDCLETGRFVAAKRIFGRADGTRVQVTRIGKYCVLAGRGVKEAMEKAEGMGRTSVLDFPSED